MKDTTLSQHRMTAVERAIALRGVEAFQGVPMNQLAYVAAAATEEWFEDGECLFRQGEPPGSLFVILDGRVRLERDGETFGDAGPGEALGTWSLFDDHPRRATATSEGNTRALALDRDDFYDVLSEHVEIARSLVQDLVRKLMKLTGLDVEDTQ